MEFALIALFAVLAFDACRDLSAPLTAGGLALVAAAIAPEKMVIIALIAYFGVLMARFWAPRLDDALTWKVN